MSLSDSLEKIMSVVTNLQVKKSKRSSNLYHVKYNLKENIVLLKYIKTNYPLDWLILKNTSVLKFITETYFSSQRKLIKPIIFHDYVWWSYPNCKRTEKLFEAINDQSQTNDGTPECILRIVELINQFTYYNKYIRRFFYFIAWKRQIFRYYNRYYRYLHNERLFGKKKFLSCAHGHKTHFISYLKKREQSGTRLNKNHLLF